MKVEGLASIPLRGVVTKLSITTMRRTPGDGGAEAPPSVRQWQGLMVKPLR